MSRGRKIRLGVASLVVAALVLVPLVLRWQAQWQLSAYRKKLIAAGEKLTVAELTPQRNVATNSERFQRLVASLRLRPFDDYYPYAMGTIKPGVARVAWQQPQLMESVFIPRSSTKADSQRTNVWPTLVGAFRTNGQTLDEIRAMVASGDVSFTQDYSQPGFNNLDYLSAAKNSVRILNARAILSLHEGELKESLRDLECCRKISDVLAKDPLIIDQLVRYACMAITATSCWEALQTNGWTDGQLAELQRQWDQPDILADARVSIALERARAPMDFEMARSSRQGLDATLGGFSGIKDNSEIWKDFLMNTGAVPGDLLDAYPRYWGWKWIWSYRDEQRYLESMQAMIEDLRDAQKGRPILSLLKDREESSNADSNLDHRKSIDIPRLMADGIERFVIKALRAQTEANMVSTAIALERYHLAHNAYPDALAKLAPDFVQKVPVDCMDGHDLRYHLNPGGTYLLYSVGEDGVDNGGDPTPEKGKAPGFFNGRDWVWPRAATAEEVQAYEAEQSKPARKQ